DRALRTPSRGGDSDGAPGRARGAARRAARDRDGSPAAGSCAASEREGSARRRGRRQRRVVAGPWLAREGRLMGWKLLAPGETRVFAVVLRSGDDVTEGLIAFAREQRLEAS